MRELHEVIKLLEDRMPLRRLRVKVLRKIYGVGKNVSHVRPCLECCVSGSCWPCTCLEIVLVGEGEGLKYSLMHEWGHAYLSDVSDHVFAAMTPCSGVEDLLNELMRSAEGYAAEGLSFDVVIDYVVSCRIKEYGERVRKIISDELSDLLELEGSGGNELNDAVICSQVATHYVLSKAMGWGESGIAGKLLKDLGCGVSIELLNKAVKSLRSGKYVLACESLLNALFSEYLGVKAVFRTKESYDPLTGQVITYKCLEIVK